MEHNRVRFVTANYHQLQGLRFVPLGLFIFAWGLLDFSGLLHPVEAVVSSEPTRLLTRIGLGFWLALLLSLAAPLYYRLRYGSVAPLDRGRRNGWITAAMIGFLVLARLDASLQWPISLRALLVAAALFVTVWNDGAVRFHYLMPASVWLAASVMPTLAVSASDQRGVMFVLGGITLVVCGIGDHLLLTRSLTKPPHTDDAPHATIV